MRYGENTATHTALHEARATIVNVDTRQDNPRGTPKVGVRLETFHRAPERGTTSYEVPDRKSALSRRPIAARVALV